MAILMTEQLAQQLIKHYEQCIKQIKRCYTVEDAHIVCYKNGVQFGICKCAIAQFNEDIYHCTWVNSYTITDGGHIGNIPSKCDTISGIIDALQTRVDILKTFKNQ